MLFGSKELLADRLVIGIYSLIFVLLYAVYKGFVVTTEIIDPSFLHLFNGLSRNITRTRNLSSL